MTSECVVCGSRTETGTGFVGGAEFVVHALMSLGMDYEQSVRSLALSCGVPDPMQLPGTFEVVVPVCRGCADPYWVGPLGGVIPARSAKPWDNRGIHSSPGT